MQPTKVFSFLTWFILLLLAVPTFLILSSWNSLPGDALYGVKRGMEEVLLTLVSPSKDLSATVSVKYSERRFIEATSLISEKHSIVGLASFEQQVQTTQQKIQSTTDPKTQQDLKNQLVSNLQTYNQQLEETKTQIASTNANNNVATQTSPANNPITNIPITTTPVSIAVTATPTIHTEKETTKSIVTVTEAPVVTIVATASNPVQPATNAQIVAAIDQTQTHISQTIKELEKEHSDNKPERKNQDKQENKGQNKEQNKNGKD